ncbi:MULTISPECIES: glycosyltransferase family 4 protein [unclassified Facklamia]|uniref:glycosyltransferase family 4 protein n=1 Tax=Aerococcaceae TaxID=186827 RepID=UPI0013BCA57C|nr:MULTISPECIES: glycosyltransferase family 4 protein [unclassified Facklamia]NEW65061.1 glycosyltransferase [Facklamia sp. 252]NEW68718.1 glycosyltransferase [Facklamia sp. 253]QQD65125.1 glycosyltransferase family 4 protein [Aerococcaceae bacterium zg-252]
MKKHILIVSQYFYPEQFRVNDIALDLVKRGYKVSVLTGIPNYPEGKYYDGYNFFSRNEKMGEVEIHRIPLLPRGKGKLGLVANYLSFVFFGFFWQIITKINPDHIFIYEVSPMTQALPGVWLAKRRKIPVTLYVTDLWPENVQIVGGINHPLIIANLEKMVKYIYRNVDNILTSSESFIDKIIERGVEKAKLQFWPQYAEEFYCPYENTFKNEIPNDGILNLTFTGNLGAAQGLDILPKVAKKLKGSKINVRFNLIGDGRYKETLIEEISKYNVEDYFNLIGKKNPEEIPKYFANSDASLIILSKNELFQMTIPAKLQSSMACSMPIIASVDGETSSIIEKSMSGLVSSSGDENALFANIVKFLEMSEEDKKYLSGNSIKYYHRHFKKDNLMDILEKVLWGDNIDSI